ncbi:hypothetical protein RND81_02G036000 [Saponaria officinalis]|uniref:Uncharacterized protein n=1 Tax=Saponaria officinalis TaxID=3572 RepID=A0AAW1MJE0_SAPOF
MGIDRRNYVMSAEFAMSREMAYRNKLQVLTQHSGSCNITDTNRDLLLSQVPTPTPGSMPPPIPRAQTSSSQIWTPNLSTDQISASTSMWRPINVPDQKKKAPMNHNQPAQLGSFYCLVCQIDCTTSYNLMMHYQGQRHKAKLQGDPRGKTVSGGNSLSTAKDRLYCKLCGIWCKDEFTFRFHLQCKNHILTLHEYEKNMKKPRN